jgi:hypothetical protein
MTKSEVNNLRPGDKVIWSFKTTTMKGRVKSVMRGGTIKIEWSDGALDEMPIDDFNSEHLEKLNH